ncbi:ParB N-terminal domain-containing protein [Streptomyces sp. MP131-18]|uniref:ParB/RepB/Spo0J family partition protein n=1 Tax=Streptomyces sp. MP131-18 TaxID=1857892 RepID=UPI00097BD6A8|nr:ParB N-terminal domain-containing protein [Streptomyces sp. MP131-18]ONK10136.1 ParB-like nuclease domain protein [Streptomyces sp. MP131-18]
MRGSSTAGATGAGSAERVSLSELTTSDSPRRSGTDAEHIRLLAESAAELPPILVNRRTMRVIDGTHRVHAAALRGEDSIEAVLLDCDDDEAFLLAVEVNVTHGLPLTRADRTAAAKRIIASHADWSDRAIASVTGLSHKTIGSIRRRSSGEIPQSATRRGRDGRVRPVDASAGRIQAGRMLADRPDTPLREIAREAGVCPATVRDVRARIQRGEAPVPAGRRVAVAPAATPLRPQARAEEEDEGPELSVRIRNLRKDPSLRFSESGRTLLRLLDACTVGPQEWHRISDNVPPHCVEIIVSAARECSRAWEDFAVELDQRRGRQKPG